MSDRAISLLKESVTWTAGDERLQEKKKKRKKGREKGRREGTGRKIELLRSGAGKEKPDTVGGKRSGRCERRQP